MNSYLNKIFVIDDPHARIRKDEDLFLRISYSFALMNLVGPQRTTSKTIS
jgi:hypothetical protein